MGRNAGGNSIPKNGGLKSGDSDYKGHVGKLYSLNTIKNKYVYKGVKGAIDRYHSVMGVRQQNVKLATLDRGVGGMHVTKEGKSSLVVINKKIFNGNNTTTQSVAKWASEGYKSGWSTKTNKPGAHIVTHELAHATWNEHLTSPKAKAASKSVNSLYKKWMKDKSKKGYGKYAKTNVSEFFAETATKAVHGKADKYTKALKTIVKRYKL